MCEFDRIRLIKPELLQNFTIMFLFMRAGDICQNTKLPAVWSRLCTWTPVQTKHLSICLSTRLSLDTPLN